MKSIRIWNRVVAAVSAVIGIAIIAKASTLKMFLSSGDPGPGFWPLVIGSIVVLCSVVLVVDSMISKNEKLEKVLSFWSPAHARVYKMMTITVLFFAVMYVLGFYIAMIIFMPMAMKLMGTESDKLVVIITACSVVVIFVAFQIGLKTILPAPIFWR